MNDNELQARIETLEAKFAYLLGLQKTLPFLPEKWRDEALALVPDNRVDGNGIRLADLEAVDDELTGRACEEGVEFS